MSLPVCYWLFTACLSIFCIGGLPIGWAFDGEWQLPLEHSITGDDHFTGRGYISLAKLSDGNITGSYVERGFVFNSADLHDRLVALAKSGREYRVRTAQNLDAPAIAQASVSSFAYPCQVIRGGLSEVILLTIDSSIRKVVSITVQPLIPAVDDNKLWSCDSDSNLQLSASAFNTTVIVKDVEEGPSPDTQLYLRKLEKERNARQHGAQQDNRSFIAKYWMYIVPIALFVMLSNAATQEPAQQGGGGG